MNFLSTILFILLASKSFFSQKNQLQLNENLPINHFQIIISHNSYRITPIESAFKKLNRFPLKSLGKQLDYHHEDPYVQLDSFDLKGLEIDIYNDPEGGRYVKAKEGIFFGGKSESLDPDMKQPGAKVLHIPGIDYNTYFHTLKEALHCIKEFSGNNPDHFPLFIMIEAKEKSLGNVFPLMLFGHKKALKFTEDDLDNIDNEIKNFFPDSINKVITPDFVRGNFSTLKEAIKTKGWPSLNELKGKIFFICLMKNKTKQLYLNNHYSLANRKMFVYTDTNSPEAAFIKIDNPLNNEQNIEELVKQGYFIRTRSDVGTEEARTGDYTRFNAAKKSGAQIISTDYYQPDYRYKTSQIWTNFHVLFHKNKTVQLNTILNHE